VRPISVTRQGDADSRQFYVPWNIEGLFVLGPIFKITKTCKSCMWSTTYSVGPMDKNYRDCFKSPPANKLLNFFTTKKEFVCPKCGGGKFEEEKTVLALG
jgi:predicted nucleic-acid-binding Zn-ribbon protein